MENLPFYISAVMIISTLLTIYLFYKAAHNSTIFLLILLGWISLQTIISLTGFYTVTNTLPPRILLVIGPPFLFIALLFLTQQVKLFIDNLDTKILTLLHIVRIPVELVLFWLFLYKAVPQIMTFEGQNFDIISGISAPLIYYFGYIKKKLNHAAILSWNIICLLLLINIVGTAILAAPLPFQQIAFDQLNIGVMYFPFVWLPCCVVPLVFLSHLAVIRQLLINKKHYF